MYGVLHCRMPGKYSQYDEDAPCDELPIRVYPNPESIETLGGTCNKNRGFWKQSLETRISSIDACIPPSAFLFAPHSYDARFVDKKTASKFDLRVRV